ncbi:hypothetical protein [Wielerella bovis]|uniref:hypothetical protein n=1 Tax=Wielerella bovis TaxID=2917790 RepID=UPI0020184B16|nr:hypothetical protein [Wielerella bovis]ULJ66194.1 hypothetical protein MIS31_07910 [Wielerella bovis]
MSQNSYNQAIEITKIILQTSPERLIGSRSNAENAKKLSLFIQTLAADLKEIESQHIKHD